MSTRLPSIALLGSIPIVGIIAGFFMLRDDAIQRSEGPFWCWRCKAEVPGTSQPAAGAHATD
jgi:hypothetical protein